MKRKIFLSVLLCFVWVLCSSHIVQADSFNGRTPVGVGFVDEEEKKKEDDKEKEKREESNRVIPVSENGSGGQFFGSKLLPQTGEEMKMGISILGVLLFSGSLFIYLKRRRRDRE